MASITFNSFDFADIGFILSRDSFQQPSEPRFETYELPLVNGSVLQNSYFSPNMITVNGYIIASSFAEKKEFYRKMMGYLYVSPVASLVFSEETTIEYLCKLNTAPSVSTISDLVLEVEIEFIAPFGGRDVTPSVTNGTVGALICDTSLSNFYSYPFIEMTGLTVGADILVSTPSTDDDLYIDDYDSTSLSINCTPGQKRIYAVTTDKNEFIRDASSFPRLLAYTASNTVSVSVSAGTSTTAITYRNVYL